LYVKSVINLHWVAKMSAKIRKKYVGCMQQTLKMSYYVACGCKEQNFFIKYGHLASNNTRIYFDITLILL